MINAMLYLTKTACQWRMLLKEFGPWQTIYFYFRKWKLERVFEELMHHLRESVRKAFGKAISPIDSKTVRTSHHIDTLGIIPVVVIHTANILRPDAAKKFTVPSKRWIVDRTFSWFESFRRLSKDNEVLPETSQTMIYLTMIQMMLNRTK